MWRKCGNVGWCVSGSVWGVHVREWVWCVEDPHTEKILIPPLHETMCTQSCFPKRADGHSYALTGNYSNLRDSVTRTSDARSMYIHWESKLDGKLSKSSDRSFQQVGRLRRLRDGLTCRSVQVVTSDSFWVKGLSDTKRTRLGCVSCHL